MRPALCNPRSCDIERDGQIMSVQASARARKRWSDNECQPSARARKQDRRQSGQCRVRPWPNDRATDLRGQDVSELLIVDLHHPDLHLPLEADGPSRARGRRWIRGRFRSGGSRGRGRCLTHARVLGSGGDGALVGGTASGGMLHLAEFQHVEDFEQGAVPVQALKGRETVKASRRLVQKGNVVTQVWV